MYGLWDSDLFCMSAGDDESSGGDHTDLALSDVLVGPGADDTTFQQLSRNPGLLDGLDFPMETLSQLPATPPRASHGGTTSGLLSPPSNVSLTILLFVLLQVLDTILHMT